MTQDTNKFKYVLACIILLAFLMVVWTLCYKVVPKENEQVFNIIVGLIAANVSNMVNYYFGTSSSSKAKDEVISSALKSSQQLNK